MRPKHRPPTHPGEILWKEFLEPLSLSQVELAKSLGVPVQRINTLINGKRGVTAETALLLAERFKTTPEFWMNLQNAWDLHGAAQILKSASA
jgi:addiction module HigA family antidote